MNPSLPTLQPKSLSARDPVGQSPRDEKQPPPKIGRRAHPSSRLRRSAVRIRDWLIGLRVWYLRKFMKMDLHPTVKLSLKANLDLTNPSGVHVDAGTYIERRIVLIGDSRMQQWPELRWNGRWDIIHRGIAGETSAQLTRRFYADAIALDPDVVVIQSSINGLVAASFMHDISSQRVIGDIERAFRELASRAAASGHQTWITTIIPPAKPDILRIAVWNESVRDAVAYVNEGLRRYRWPDRVRLIDLSAVLGSVDDRLLPDRYRRDTLHLNRVGYEQLTAVLTQQLHSAFKSYQP
jgi:lysophospholipase L1-like esterase